jgi:hypothetical protein
MFVVFINSQRIFPVFFNFGIFEFVIDRQRGDREFETVRANLREYKRKKVPAAN